MRRINLNRVEVFGIEREHILCGKLFRIERAQPVFVIPAGSADVNPCRHFAYDLSP
jgi:hypothetical protein